MHSLLNENYICPPGFEDIVNQEFNLINSFSSAYSPIFNYIEDFIQYIPRGHYDRNEILQRYFKAMMYAERMTFDIKRVKLMHTYKILLQIQ